MNTLVVDNGAFTAKAGYIPAGAKASDFANPLLPISPTILPNCTAKSRAEKKFFVADGLNSAVDLSALYIRRPHERGYVVHWDIEEEIFERMCHKDVLGVKPADTSLFVTEPLLSPTELKDNLDEFCFETMGFARLCTATPPLLAFNDHKHWDPDSVLSRTGCGVVVDSGFSFTHVAPLFEGRVLHKACRRIDVGGKVLTNLLKEQLSYRQWNMMDENILMNTIKERLSFVSLDFDSDLDTCRRRGAANTVRRRYALPTGIDDEDKHGCVVESESASPSKRAKADGDGDKQQNKSNRLDSECMLDMNNERFCVPEVLFCPSMIGMNQSGIQGAIQDSIEMLAPDMRPLLYSTVITTGGNSLIPNYMDRVQHEVRSIAPCDFEVEVPRPLQRADEGAWRGAVRLATSGKVDQIWVTKQEYEEKGHILCRQKLKEVEDVLWQKGKKSSSSAAGAGGTSIKK